MSVLSSVTGGRKFSLFLSFTSDLMLNLCIDTYVILIVHHSLTQHLLPSLNKQSSPLLSLVLCPVSVLGPAKLPSWWTKKFSSPLTTGPPPPVILMAILFVRWVKLPPKKRSKSPFSLNTRFHIDLSVRLSWTVSHPREIIGSSPRRIWNVWSGGIEKTWEVWISAVLIPLGVRISMMRYMRGGCRMVISRLVSVSSPFPHSVCTKRFWSHQQCRYRRCVSLCSPRQPDGFWSRLPWYHCVPRRQANRYASFFTRYQSLLIEAICGEVGL